MMPIGSCSVCLFVGCRWFGFFVVCWMRYEMFRVLCVWVCSIWSECGLVPLCVVNRFIVIANILLGVFGK